MIRWIPFIYANVLATFGYGALFGIVCGKLMKFARVRNNQVAFFSGLSAGIISLYMAWNGHIHAVFQNAPVFCLPNDVFDAMKQLYAHGSWGFHESAPLTGILLAIVWVIEAGIIIGLSTLLCFEMVDSTPFCETSQCWLDQKKKIDTVAPFADPAQLAAFKAGDLGALTQARPRDPLASRWTRILLKHSPRCAIFHTVRLQDITIHLDKKGNPKEKAKNLSRDLILPADMFGLLSKFEHFGATPAPAVEAPPATPVQV